jgi:Zn-dependent oligopeptidase
MLVQRTMRFVRAQHVNTCVLVACCCTQGVKDSDALRAAVEEVQPENVALGLRLAQSKPLYTAFKALK